MNCNKHKKNGKTEKKCTKNPFSSRLRIPPLILRLTHICSCLGAADFNSPLHSRPAPLPSRSLHSHCTCRSPSFPLLSRSPSRTKQRNLRKQGSLTLSLSDRPVEWVGSHSTCFGTSRAISEAFPSTSNL